MIDEHNVREMLQRRAGAAPAVPADTPKAVQRARRRLVLNGAVAMLAVVAIAGATLAGIDAIRSAPVPVDTPSPSPSRELASFSSVLHEVTIGYPTGWEVRPATEPWGGGRLTFDASDVDVIFDPTRGEDLYLALVSKPLGGQSREDWVSGDFWKPGICAKTTSGGAGPIHFDGAKRYDTVSCGGGPIDAARGHYLRVATDTRGYLIYLHDADLERSFQPGISFFNALLETLELESS
jgi:hypothetical protein